MMDATGNVQSVLVLGGGSEIGEAIVRRLAAGRARRVVLAGRPGRRDEVARRLRADGVPHVATLDWDATAVDGHREALDAVFRADGDIDLVLSAVGVLGDEAAGQRDGRVAASVLDTNFTGVAAALVDAAECLRRQGHGTIAVLSSVAGVRVRPANYVYGASKAALDAFAGGLGHALAADGVHVLVVRPGFVRTRMTAGRSAAPLATTPEAVAEAVAAGLRRRASVVWAPPALRWLALVLRLLPRPVLRRLPA